MRGRRSLIWEPRRPSSASPGETLDGRDAGFAVAACPVSPGDKGPPGSQIRPRLPLIDKRPVLRFERRPKLLSPILLGRPHFRTAQPGDNPLCPFPEIFSF